MINNKIVKLLIHQQGLIFNLLFVIYQLFLKQPLLQNLKLIHNHLYKNYLLAILFISISILEVLGYFIKLPNVQKRLLKHFIEKKEIVKVGGFATFSWMLHLVLGIILLMWTTYVDTRINGNQHRKHRIRTQCILYVCNFTSNNKRIDHTFFDINFFSLFYRRYRRK